MIKPGLVSITFRQLSCEQIVELAKECGLAGVEWGGDIHVRHGDIAAGEKVGELMKEAGLVTAAYGWIPDRDGNLGDIVLGFDNLKDYEEKSPYFGCLIGRYGNRIGKGKFSIDGKEYMLVTNDKKNHLHGGLKGFDKVIWSAEPIQNKKSVGLKLRYQSKDMEEGYPGNLDVTVTYTLTNQDEFVIDYKARTDKPTVCNLTNHNYYNLSGQGIKNNYENQLYINADYYTPVDESLITTGELRSVNRKETFVFEDDEAAIRIEKTGKLPETVTWTNTGFDKGIRTKGGVESYTYRFEGK